MNNGLEWKYVVWPDYSHCLKGPESGPGKPNERLKKGQLDHHVDIERREAKCHHAFPHDLAFQLSEWKGKKEKDFYFITHFA